MIEGNENNIYLLLRTISFAIIAITVYRTTFRFARVIFSYEIKLHYGQIYERTRAEDSDVRWEKREFLSSGDEPRSKSKKKNIYILLA